MTTPRVYSLRAGAESAPPGAIRVDRRTPWGNPFLMRFESADLACLYSRAWAIAEFRKYALGRLTREPDWLLPLRGKNLLCWCAPKPCHADVLIELANGTGDGDD